MKEDFSAKRIAYDTLKSVYSGAYSSIELDRLLSGAKEDYRGYITAIVYSVLEQDIKLNYVISKLCVASPKQNVRILLKMGIAELFGSDRRPEKIVNEYVAFARNRFRGAEGFVNAALRKASGVAIPSGNDDESLSIRYSVPEWVIKRLKNDYPGSYAEFFSFDKNNATHVRRNSRRISEKDFSEKLESTGCKKEKTDYGWFVDRSALKSLDADSFTPQSVSSIITAEIACGCANETSKVLDLCSAPGGKAVYINERTGCSVTACDVHPHRVKLIESYAKRMGAGIMTEVNDATVLRGKWLGAFDLVLCDVPCSGSGLLRSSPDILLFKEESELDSLNAIQSKILAAAGRYVKSGGTLLYSTCSLFRRENDDVVNGFLNSNADFTLGDIGPVKGLGDNDELSGGVLRLMPSYYHDGFFICKMVKK